MSTPYTGQTATAEVSEAHGYEQILGAHNDEVERRTHLAERAANELAEAEEADAGYELHIGMLRSHKADDASIEDVVHLREANEQGIAAARDRHSAALSALAAAVAARDNWVGRHGAVYEAKVNTNTSGDEALYTP